MPPAAQTATIRLGSSLSGVSVLAIDDTGALLTLLNNTQATLTHLSTSQLLVGHRHTLAGDVRSGRFGLVAIIIPPRRFISPRLYTQVIAQLCGLIRTAVGGGIPMVTLGSERRFQSGRTHDLEQLCRDKVVHRANIRHCTLALTLPNDVTPPIDGCTTMLTAKPHSHALCQHGSVVHYNIYQQHRSDTRAQLESHVDTQVTAKLLAQAFTVEPPLVGRASNVQRDCGLRAVATPPKLQAPRAAKSKRAAGGDAPAGKHRKKEAPPPQPATGVEDEEEEGSTTPEYGSASGLELTGAIHEIVRTSDLTVLTARAMREELEVRLELQAGSLKERKQEVGRLIDAALAALRSSESSAPAD